MKKEEKELLLQDLCARLPYNPMVEYKGKNYNVLGITHERLVLCKPFMSHTLDEHPLVKEVKPYLFPLSTMTDEQSKELEEIDPEFYSLICENGDICVSMDVRGYDWLNKNHFDYRGLIPMGQALDATGLKIY